MRILICEDSVLLREGLVRLLEEEGSAVVAAVIASAVLSPMCRSGTSRPSVTASATVCIVFVHRSTISAPAACSDRASVASSSPARAQSPASCSRAISAKSTDSSTHRAECRPPSSSRTDSLSSR